MMTFTRAAQYLQTIKHLKFKQIFYRCYYRIVSPAKFQIVHPVLSEYKNKWINSIIKTKQNIQANEWCFLNQQLISEEPPWQNKLQSKLWLYHLHYFDYLLADQTPATKEMYSLLIDQWVQENPYPCGIGWEPYPTSIRIINWIKWHLQYHPLSERAQESLLLQLRYLNTRREYHILANHLFANAVALCFGGVFFDNSIAKSIAQDGLVLLNEQLAEQVLADGGHYELSPMYQSLILENILDLINLLQTYNVDVPSAWLELVRKMFTWLSAMTHPDDDLSYFNDSVSGVATTCQQLLTYAHRLDILNDVKSDKSTLLTLEQSGYVSVSLDKLYLVADIGTVGCDYQPGHSHADHLSFELSLYGQRILVNRGISTYEVGSKRLQERSTAAHNTLTIDNKNSSDVWSSFRVARRARIIAKEIHANNDLISIVAKHDGYQFISGITHQRSWVVQQHQLIVEDKVDGGELHDVNLYFHFYPNLQLNEINKNCFEIQHNLQTIATIEFDQKMACQIKKQYYCLGFGDVRDSLVIVANVSTALPLAVQTKLWWASG